MLKNIRKYGWWAATLTMWIVVLATYASPLPGWVWMLSGVVFMALWVKAETLADEYAAKELAAKEKVQEAGDGIALGESGYPVTRLRPYNDYYLSDEERLREVILQEMEEALAEDETDLKPA